jgi:hypothetical protein
LHPFLSEDQQPKPRHRSTETTTTGRNERSNAMSHPGSLGSAEAAEGKRAISDLHRSLHPIAHPIDSWSPEYGERQWISIQIRRAVHAYGVMERGEMTATEAGDVAVEVGGAEKCTGAEQVYGEPAICAMAPGGPVEQGNTGVWSSSPALAWYHHLVVRNSRRERDDRRKSHLQSWKPSDTSSTSVARYKNSDLQHQQYIHPFQVTICLVVASCTEHAYNSTIPSIAAGFHETLEAAMPCLSEAKSEKPNEFHQDRILRLIPSKNNSNTQAIFLTSSITAENYEAYRIISLKRFPYKCHYYPLHGRAGVYLLLCMN